MLIVFGLQLSAFELFSDGFPISLGKIRVSGRVFNARGTDKVLKKIKKGGIAPAFWRRRKRLATVTHAPLATSISETCIVKIGVDSAADPCRACCGRISGDHPIASMNNFYHRKRTKVKEYIFRQYDAVFSGFFTFDGR
jgi:hypothetical protein